MDGNTDGCLVVVVQYPSTISNRNTAFNGEDVAKRRESLLENLMQFKM